MKSLLLIRGEGPHLLIAVAGEEVAKVQLRHHLSQAGLTVFELEDKIDGGDVGDLFFEHYRGLELLNVVLADHVGDPLSGERGALTLDRWWWLPFRPCKWSRSSTRLGGRLPRLPSLRLFG